MPVVSNLVETTMQLLFEAGVDEKGDPVFKKSYFHNVKPTSTEQDIYDVATALASLQQYTLNKVYKEDLSSLDNEL